MYGIVFGFYNYRLVLCVLLYSVVLCDSLLFGYVCEFVIAAFDDDE